MIIEQITIKNWRGYREPHTFKFEDGINLMAGRNEAGKSTLFEALTRVLFDRHNSKSGELCAMQPIGSTLGPEAEIWFRSDGQRYRAVKRFLDDPTSELYLERGGTWELNHNGDEADTRLREVLSGDTYNRASKAEHRGLAQALWYLQSDGAIPKDAWSDGVKQGLQGLVQLAARLPIEADIIDRISQSNSEYWTPTGRGAPTNSELGRLAKELPELKGQLDELVEKASSSDKYRRDIEETQSLAVGKKTEHDSAQAELAELSALVQRAKEFEKECEVKERDRDKAVREAERPKEDLSQVREKQKRVSELQAEVERLDEAFAEGRAESEAQAEARDRHLHRRKEELEPALKGLEADLKSLQALERLRKLEKDRKRLEKQVTKVEALKVQLDARRDERSALTAPNDAEWGHFGTVSRELSVVHAKMEASGVSVAFEWTQEARKVETLPILQLSSDDEYLVTEPTVFEIEGVGKVRVRSGAPALEDLRKERDHLAEEIQQSLTRFGVADTDGMAELYEQGRELDRVISTHEQRLEDTQAVEPGAADELARVKRGIEEEGRGTSTLAPETREQGGEWIRDQIGVKDSDKQRLIQEIEDEEVAEKAAETKRLDAEDARTTTSTQLAEGRAEIKVHQGSMASILENYATVERLEELVATSEEEVAKATAAFDASSAEFEEKVTKPKQRHDLAQKRVLELKEGLDRLGTDIATTQARIDESADQGNYSKLADLEIEVDRKKKRIEALELRANGAQLLYRLVAAREKERSAALSGPIQERVNHWLRLLTDDNYDALAIDHDLKPTGVHMARYNEELPLMSLSHGAQEQIVVLLRLGIAVLVSKDERNLVVIDDRLVNADSVRMRRLCMILQEASEHCQIVIATCNDTPYAGLGAHLVRVPADGLETEVSL